MAVSLLNKQANTIALAEPFVLNRQADRQRAVDDIIGLMRDFRSHALAGAPLPTKHVGGSIPDNWVEPPHQNAQLRRVFEERGDLQFDKALSPDFTLVVKHPAEFTALADLLVEHFPLFAIVRDPLAVLAAWQTVSMPINRGRMPMMECFAPHDLQGQLDRTEDTLARQIVLLEFQLTTYLALGRDKIIRYEDMVAHPRDTLAPICAIDTDLPGQSPYDPIARYPGLDFVALAAGLQPIMPLIEEFYPDFQRRWQSVLPARTMVPAAPARTVKPEYAPLAPPPSDDPRIFVMGAYIPAGGTHMAYEVGRVAHRRLGLNCYAVQCGKESAGQSLFDYPDVFDSVPREDLPEIVRPQDILICNPSFSDGSVGLTHNCQKLMYVQGFNTFSTLDCWFDQHIAVGGFVQDFLANVYGIKAPVIRPYVATDAVRPRPWWGREPKSIWFYLKGSRNLQLALLHKLRAEIYNIDADAEAAIDWEDSVIWAGGHRQADLLTKLAERRHFVSLSVCEGFGLVPLEAMAVGTMVMGFDGFGGRDYMRSGANCCVQAYPHMASMARDLAFYLKHPERAAAIAARGPATAARYSRQAFETSWQARLQTLLDR